jgi:histidine decarboxylase
MAELNAFIEKAAFVEEDATLLTKVCIQTGYKIHEPNTTDSEEQKNLDDHVSKIIEDYAKHLEERTSHHLGYPYNLDFDFSELQAIQGFSINNLGDPFVESNYGVHSRKFEIGVLEWFARVWEINPQDMWGYVTNCGTEGNLHGILTGREVLPEGILYCSDATHYSVPKAARMYRMPLSIIPANDQGEMDLNLLKNSLCDAKMKNKSATAIINCNIGTTVKGGVDDLTSIINILDECGYIREEYFIHCDGALFGLMMPHAESEKIKKEIADIEFPTTLSFKRNIDSISVSGHKFIGAPMPCGVVITRKAHIAKMSTDIEYLNSKDATIMGSRNGHAALYLWYAIQKKGIEGFRNDTLTCIRNARSLKDMIINAGVKAFLNDLSCTVVFEKPTNWDFVRKWQLACQGDIAHVVVMPSTRLSTLERFVSELKACYKQDLTKNDGESNTELDAK